MDKRYISSLYYHYHYHYHYHYRYRYHYCYCYCYCYYQSKSSLAQLTWRPNFFTQSKEHNNNNNIILFTLSSRNKISTHFSMPHHAHCQPVKLQLVCTSLYIISSIQFNSISQWNIRLLLHTKGLVHTS